MEYNLDREFDLYRDIRLRTDGEIYIGVIGPVRTGKSTLINRIMDLFVLPNMEDGPEKVRIMDELPQSGSGKTITTTEPKFLPKEAFDIQVSKEVPLKVRLIDCVGYMVQGAVGHMEEEAPRMVKTPWFDEKIPFVKAAEIGTGKVMKEHSTIGIVVTCDGSFSELSRENYIEAEKRTIEEMKKLGKPFVVVLNSNSPRSTEVKILAEKMELQYQVPVLPMNCEQLKRDDILTIFEFMLKEFPITDIEIFVPEWVELLSENTAIKKEILEGVRGILQRVQKIQDITEENLCFESSYVKNTKIEQVNLSNGNVQLLLEIDQKYYYDVLSRMTGEDIRGESGLLKILKELSGMKKEYVKIQGAVDAVRQKGYGVVLPDQEDIVLEGPVIVKQGNKYGVKLKASAPSFHMIRANIETEVSPLVGSESQANDLINYIENSKKEEGDIWKTNIFGKTIRELVEDGVKTKIYQVGEESQNKLQETMQKIVNDSTGGMICIII